MKKIIAALLFALLPGLVHAQIARETYIDRDLVALLASVFFAGLAVVFLLELVKRYLNHRLKEKILESGADDQLAQLLLHSEQADHRRGAVKWIFVFAGLFCGFTVMAVATLSIWPALAAMALCLTGSFLGYYYFLKRNNH